MMSSLAAWSLDVPCLCAPALLEHNSILGAVLQMVYNFLLQMAWPCFRTLRIYFVILLLMLAIKSTRHFFSITDISNTMGSASLRDSRGRDVFIIACNCCEDHFYSGSNSNLKTFCITW